MDTMPVNKSSQLIDVRQKAPQLDTSGAGSALGAFMSMVNMIQQSKTNSENVKNQFELLNREQRFQREMNENMYKTYRRSLEGAGFNVNSALGGFPNTGSPSVSPTTQSAPQFDLGVASLLQQQPLINAQTDLVSAQAEKTRSEVPNVEADTVLKKAQAFNINELTEPQRQKLEEEVKNVRESTENLKVNRAETMEKINLLLGQTEGQRLSNELLKQETPLILQKYAAEIANLWSQKYLNNAQTAAAYKSLLVMTAQINELNSRAKLNDSQRTYVANLAFGVALDNQFKPFEQATGLEFTDQQIQEIKETIGKIQQDKDWAPFNNIFGAFSAPMGAAAGAYFGSRAKGSAVSGISLPANSTWTK